MEITKLLTVDEFATALGLKATTVRSWIFYEQVPFVRVGDKAIRFHPATLEAIQNGT